jgi:hypothetical protein
MPAINPDDLGAAAAKLRLAIDYADKASDYSEEADPDWWMWGLPGVVTADLYFTLADGWRGLLSDAGQGIEGLAKRLEDSGTGWSDVDSFLGEDFAKVLTDLEGATGDFVRGTQNPPPVTQT